MLGKWEESLVWDMGWDGGLCLWDALLLVEFPFEVKMSSSEQQWLFLVMILHEDQIYLIYLMGQNSPGLILW